jgi:cephalosporin-C deacetylase-like acetyl esterase
MYFKTINLKKGSPAPFILFFCLFISNLSAQFSLTLDKETADYKLEETAEISILSSQSGTASFRFFYDENFPDIQTGTVDVSANTPINIPFTTDNSGVVFCEVMLNEELKKTAFVFGRNNIKVFNEEPADFDAFWENQIQLARDIPLDPQITLLSTEEGFTNYRISVANLDGRRTYGYISVPNDGDNFPAFITLPPFGDGAGQVAPTDFLTERCNAITISLSIHNAEPDESDPNAYAPNNSSNRETYYYRYGILGTIRIIDYLFEREDFDGENLGLTGVSQGGGLSLIVAGLDERVKLLAISNPALCHHAGYEYGREAGFPDYLKQSADSESDAHYAQTLEASAYYDAAFFAKRYNGPTLVNISYLDEVTPAETSFAAINNLRGFLLLTHSLNLGHEHPGAFWDGRFSFFRRIFENAQNPPFFISTGYWSEIEGENELDVNTETVLNSFVFQEEEELDLPSQWIEMSGTGNVNFSDDQSSMTSVNFSESGTYVLKCERADTEELDTGNNFTTISNFLTINVLGNEVSIRETEKPASTFNLFPNPTQSELHIDLQKYAGKKALIRLNSVSGQVLMEYPVENLPADILELDLPYLLDGNYIITAQVDGLRALRQSFLVLRN